MGAVVAHIMATTRAISAVRFGGEDLMIVLFVFRRSISGVLGSRLLSPGVALLGIIRAWQNVRFSSAVFVMEAKCSWSREKITTEVAFKLCFRVSLFSS